MHVLRCGLIAASLAVAQILFHDEEFRDRYNFSGGRLVGSTAAFGAPPYGEEVLGELVYAPSKGSTYCTEDDYNPQFASGTNAIFVVMRGNCSFVTKVRVAEAKKAAAVVIVDNSGILTPEDVRRVVMASDGWGAAVTIPSIFLAQADGQPIIDALQQGKELKVTLSWTLEQTADHMQVNLWTSAGEKTGSFFLADFAKHALRFKSHLEFQQSYHVEELSGQTTDFNDQCWDGDVRYCEADPDGAGPITGREVLGEGLRQQCIWDTALAVDAVTKKPDGTDRSPRPYSPDFYRYVEKAHTECPFVCDNSGAAAVDQRTWCTSPDHRLGERCSQRVMRLLNINVQRVTQCVEDKALQLLQGWVERRQWTKVFLQINGKRYSGPLTGDVVGRVLCQEFAAAEQAVIPECSEISSENRSSGGEDDDDSGLGAGTVMLITIGVGVGVAVLLLVYYQICLKAQLRKELRYEMMQAARTGGPEGQGTGAAAQEIVVTEGAPVAAPAGAV